MKRSVEGKARRGSKSRIILSREAKNRIGDFLPDFLNPRLRVHEPAKRRSREAFQGSIGRMIKSAATQKEDGPEANRTRRMIGRMTELIQVLSWKQSNSELVGEEEPKSFRVSW
ncbi:hypothetical protein LR48_Vigan148s000800 [Vigna angularis]|uniref:Uncharacterized protein n=2 Tax=Phaseolus angularis TaxID=3914 RepID=A0A0L9T6A9_PHAAN|nr:hypothetical protein LR48_Vigan148s000800 [Vigna angularis]BAT99628.1 hypothetical protein VIGAN_10111500 [Vigna angularis var. angularis]